MPVPAATAPSPAVAGPAALPPARFTWRHRLRLLRARASARGRLTVEGRPWLGSEVVLDLARAARLVLGDRSVVGDRCRVHAASGTVRIGADAVLGEGCVLAAHAGIDIGQRCRLGDGVVVIDFDHVFADVEAPIRLQGVTTEPVQIGDGTRIGPGAAVLRGVRIGPGATVGAHAVVTRDVPAGTEVAGVPARRPDT